MHETRKGNICLFISAIVWGFAIVAQKKGMDFLGPFGFTSIRCLLGGISLIPIVWYMHNKSENAKNGAFARQYTTSKVGTIKYSIICGFFLAALVMFQQFGLQYTTVGKAAFITALYIPITPILESLSGKKISKYVWVGAGIAVIGMYLLTMSEGLSMINKGDIIMLGAALCTSLQMIVVDKCVAKVEPVKLSCYQFIVAGLICLPPALIFEVITVDAIKASLIPILYAGFISCGIGYSFQVIGQKYTIPSKAAIILSMETVFSLIAGYIFYSEVFKPLEYLGCLIMFTAILVSQKQENESHCTRESKYSNNECINNI